MPDWGGEGSERKGRGLSSETPSSHEGQQEVGRGSCHFENAPMSPCRSRWSRVATWLFLAILSLNPYHHRPILQVRKLRTAGEENDLAEVDHTHCGPTQMLCAHHAGRGLTGGPLCENSVSSLTCLFSLDWKKKAILGLVEGRLPLGTGARQGGLGWKAGGRI